MRKQGSYEQAVESGAKKVILNYKLNFIVYKKYILSSNLAQRSIKIHISCVGEFVVFKYEFIDSLVPNLKIV